MIRALALLCCLSLPATAQMVSEPPGETRVRELAKTLRCPVCQSESILDSRAPTAREMMVILREMAEAGKSDAEITAFFRDRYGDFVMLAPPKHGAGRLVWALPLVLLGGGGLVLGTALWRRADAPPADGPPLDTAKLREIEL